MKKLSLIGIIILVVFTSLLLQCTNVQVSSEDAGNKSARVAAGTLVFQSGFEAGSSSNTNFPRVSILVKDPTKTPVVLDSTKALIKGFTQGLDQSAWRYDIADSSNKWYSNRINYGTNGGDLYDPVTKKGDHLARIITDPTNSTNKVMNFILKNAKEASACPGLNSKKGRVQFEIDNRPFNTSIPTNASNVREYYQKIKFYLPTDFSVIKNSNFPEDCEWISLFEYHNKTLNSTEDLRMTIYVSRSSATTTSGNLYFKMKLDESPNPATTGWTNVSASSELYTSTFAIPFEKWIETEIYIKEGKDASASGGRFYMAARANGVNEGLWTKIADYKGRTVGVTNSNPAGMTDWSPMKFYCPYTVVKKFNDAGKLMQIYWDDLEIWENRQPSFLP